MDMTHSTKEDLREAIHRRDHSVAETANDGENDQAYALCQEHTAGDELTHRTFVLGGVSSRRNRGADEIYTGSNSVHRGVG